MGKTAITKARGNNMDNSFFILSKQKIEISRFHMCTWDIENEKSFIEFGFEFDFPNNTQEVEFKLVVPFVQNTTPVTCLLSNLISDTENCKFIFNDNIKEFSYLDASKKSGGIISFDTRGKLAILPIESTNAEQIVSINVKNQKSEKTHSYIRFLIATDSQTIAKIKKGIAQASYIFDFKLNEKRNLPDSVYIILKNEYTFCTVKCCFCFHVVPDTLNISFVDQAKLKNIRELEVSAFKKYLPNELKTMKEGKYMIVFNKDKDMDAYAFFTIFSKEIIGTKQILLAIGANILCSLLFGVSVLRNSFDASTSIWKQIPTEYWIACSILVVFILWLFAPRKRIKSFFQGRKQ